MTPSDDPADSRTWTIRAGGQVPRAILALLRVYLGVVFLMAVWSKLTAEAGFRPGLEGFLQNFALNNAHAFYRPFLESVVLPNAGLFAPLIQAAELFVAIGLLTGTATRLAAGIAMLLVLNYMLAKGAWFWTPSSNDAAFFFIGFVLILGAAGRTFGIDGVLHRRYPRVPLW